MTREEAINYLQSSGFSEEQIATIEKALYQEPFINKPCVSEKVCEHDKNKVLDKLRAEIEKSAFDDVNGSKFIFVNRVNQIIDKYKSESEEYVNFADDLIPVIDEVESESKE